MRVVTRRREGACVAGRAESGGQDESKVLTRIRVARAAPDLPRQRNAPGTPTITTWAAKAVRRGARGRAAGKIEPCGPWRTRRR